MTQHSVNIIGMDLIGFIGKDSATGSKFVLPFDQFHSKGRILLEGPTTLLCKNIDFIVCLCNKKDLGQLDPEFMTIVMDSICTPDMVDPDDLE